MKNLPKRLVLWFGFAGYLISVVNYGVLSLDLPVLLREFALYLCLPCPNVCGSRSGEIAAGLGFFGIFNALLYSLLGYLLAKCIQRLSRTRNPVVVPSEQSSS